MERESFIARYPRVFHMAEAGSWPSIRERGLLSTEALVDLYEPSNQTRAEVLDQVRKEMTYLRRDGLPNVAIRDQKPLKFIEERLLPGTTLSEFLNALNSRVFFHATEARLRTLLTARPYRSKPHDVLTLDTRTLLASHPNVDLCPYNSGSVHLRTMPRRGPATFQPLEEYDWEAWRRIRGPRNAVAELTIRHRANVSASVITVEEWTGENCTRVVYES